MSYLDQSQQRIPVLCSLTSCNRFWLLEYRMDRALCTKHSPRMAKLKSRCRKEASCHLLNRKTGVEARLGVFPCPRSRVFELYGRSPSKQHEDTCDGFETASQNVPDFFIFFGQVKAF
eukprot:6148865-Amphidinium_carterae.1